MTFFLGDDAEVLRAGVPHFFLRAARGYEFFVYFDVFWSVSSILSKIILATQTYGAFFKKNLNRNKAYTSLYLKNFRAARAK